MKKETSFNLFYNRDPQVGLPAEYSGVEDGARWLLKKKSASLAVGVCEGQPASETDANLYIQQRATDGAGTECFVTGDSSAQVGNNPGTTYLLIELGKIISGVYTRVAVDLSASVLAPDASGDFMATGCVWDSVLGKFVILAQHRTFELISYTDPYDNQTYYYWSVVSSEGVAISVTTAGVVADITSSFPAANVDTTWFKPIDTVNYTVEFSAKGGGRYYVWASSVGFKCWNAVAQTIITVVGQTRTFTVKANGDVARAVLGGTFTNPLQVIAPDTGVVTVISPNVGAVNSLIHLSGPDLYVMPSGNSGQVYLMTAAGVNNIWTGSLIGSDSYPDTTVRFAAISPTDWITCRIERYPSPSLPWRFHIQRATATLTPFVTASVVSANYNNVSGAGIPVGAGHSGMIWPKNRAVLLDGANLITFGPSNNLQPLLLNATTLLPTAVTYTPFGVRITPATGPFAALMPAMYIPEEKSGKPVVNLSVLISKMDGGDYPGTLPKGSYAFGIGGRGPRAFSPTLQVAVTSLDSGCVLAGSGTMYRLEESRS